MDLTQVAFCLVVSLGVLTFHQISAMMPSILTEYYKEVNAITDDCLTQTCTLEWEIPYCDVDDDHKSSGIPLHEEHFCLRLCLFHLASISKNEDLKALFKTYTMNEASHKKYSCYKFKRISAEPTVAPTTPPSPTAKPGTGKPGTGKPGTGKLTGKPGTGKTGTAEPTGDPGIGETTERFEEFTTPDEITANEEPTTTPKPPKPTTTPKPSKTPKPPVTTTTMSWD